MVIRVMQSAIASFITIAMAFGLVSIAQAQTIRLGMSPHLLPDQPNYSASYDVQVDRIASLGFDSFYSSRLWTDLEPTTPGSYNFVSLDQDLARYASHQMQGGLFTFRFPDTSVRGLPADFASLAWNDPAVLSRGLALVDAFTTRGGNLAYVSLGNEIDHYFKLHPDEIAAFEEFHRTLRDRIKSRRPDLQVGLTIAANSLTDPDSNQRLNQLFNQSDFVALTYYPLNEDFTVKPTSSTLTDFQTFRQVAANLGINKLAIQEAGCPTSTTLNSSNQHQADFVQNIFQSVAGEPSRFIFLNFFLQASFSPAETQYVLEYYGNINFPQNFGAYLRSLGYYEDDGSAKPAVAQFISGISLIHSLATTRVSPWRWLPYE